MSSYRVLIVDDQREVARMLRASLETLSPEFDVIEVPSGEEALLDASMEKVDLLISDVRLPGISGLELMSKLRAKNPQMKVILITGVTDPHLRQQVADAGAEAFFLKPIVMADFLDAVERILGLVEDSTPAGLAEEEQVSVQGVSDCLANLRNELDAISAVMLNDRGQVVVQAGDLPDAGIESTLMPALMAMFSAGQKIAHYLGKPQPESLFVFRGSRYDLVFAHVGQNYGLLVVVNALTGDEAVSQVSHTVSEAVRDLREVLAYIGVPLQAQEAVSYVPPFLMEVEASEGEPFEEVDETLEEVLTNSQIGELRAEDVDSFWESASEQGDSSGIFDSDALSYEQALRLGLAPRED